MSMRPRVWFALLAACSAAFAVSCGADEPKSAAHVEPVYGEPCRFASCGDHGVCAETREGDPECMCEVGYDGASCSVCEPGFHRDFNGRCLTDVACAEQPSNPCGPNGACLDSQGVIMCECETGYEGPRCNLCADRYQWDDEGRCLPLFITDGPDGPNGCIEGYAGPSCLECAAGYHREEAACVVDEMCTPDSCPPNAICRVVEGKALCDCRLGYVAPGCTQCLPDHYLDESGACLPSETCAAEQCPDTASCVLVEGDATCQCFAQYTGETCSECAAGHHDADGACVQDETCGADACPAHSTCTVAAGIVECPCDAGYFGQTCAECTVGYHLSGSSCVPDEFCQSNTCSNHTTCVVVGGETRCDCEPGWDGAQCDRCVDLATESTAFEFVTGWTTVANTCATRPELSVSRLTLRSQHGTDYVELCARSTFHALNTQHVALTAATQPAELVFWRPVVLISFDYASAVDMLALDVVVDGEKVDEIDLAPHFKDSLTLRLDQPAETIALVSRNGARQTISIDNVVFHYENCE